MSDKRDYLCIRAYCDIMGSKPYYIEDELKRAREDNAPQDAWSFDETDNGLRKWRRAKDLPVNSDLRMKFEQRGLL